MLYICSIPIRKTDTHFKQIEIMKLNISKEGIEKAMNSRNNVLNAMGFDSDESTIESEEVKTIEKEVNNNNSFSKYGDVVETEISHNVFEVSYQRQDLYIQDLNKEAKGFFVGE